MGVRILASITPELRDEIKLWARARGLTMSSVINLSLQGGFMALKISYDPAIRKAFESGPDAEALAQGVAKIAKKEKKK